MSACRPTVLVFTALNVLILTGMSPAESDYVDLGKCRVKIVKIPAGSFRMGPDQVVHADDSWTPCPSCPPRNEVERPVHLAPSARISGWASSTSPKSNGRM
jgi:hypothetical protein